jgi:hypothetical protein
MGFAATQPILHLYFIRRVPDKIYILSLMLTSAILFLWNTVLSNQNIRLKFHHIYLIVFVADVLLYLLMCIFASLDINTIALYLGLTLTQVSTGVVAYLLLRDMWNLRISGFNLTSYDATIAAANSIGSLSGTALGFLTVDYLDIHGALAAQLGICAVCTIVETFLYLNLRQK